jgi:hypothetical protein
MVLGLIFMSCSENKEIFLKQKIDKYFLAWNNQKFNHSDFSEFKRDTSYTWHNKKGGKGNQSIFNANSGSKQWDKAWNGAYSYDIIKIDTDSLKVTGTFRETTDFLRIIGMPEGYKAIVTYWFDDDYRVKETLYEWNPNNKKMSEVIQPIVEWAMKNDSIKIQTIYLKDGFKPNTENAREWKTLLDRYKNTLPNNVNN